jgi:hypothetical protein
MHSRKAAVPADPKQPMGRIGGPVHAASSAIASRGTGRSRIRQCLIGKIGNIGNIKPNWVIPGTVVPDRPVMAVMTACVCGERRIAR